MVVGSAVVSGVVLVFALLKVFVPTTPQHDIDEVLLQENTRKYQLYEYLAVPLIFVFIALFTFLTYLAGNAVTSLLDSAETSLYYSRLNSDAWLFPGVVFSFGLLYVPMELVYTALLGKKGYRHYTEFTNRKHGFDGEKIMKPVAKFMVVAGLLISLLLTQVSFRLTRDELIINRFFSLSADVYSLNEIDVVGLFETKIAPNGEAIEKKYYVLYDRSGNEIWDSSNMFVSTGYDLIDILQAHTNVDVINLEPQFIED